MNRIREWFDHLENIMIIIFGGGEEVKHKSLEKYRREAHVQDMAHSGDPSTLTVDPENSKLISIIRYYEKYNPETYETWRRLCSNSGINPDDWLQQTDERFLEGLKS